MIKKKFFIYLYWSPKEILLCHLVKLEVTFVFVRDIDVHIQLQLFGQERIFGQALNGINGILSTRRHKRKDPAESEAFSKE